MDERKTLSSEPLMNTQGAAEFLGVSPGKVKRWRYSGGGPPFIKMGSLVRYDPDSLRQFAEKNTQK
jgi:hypothetical protein